MQKALLFCFIVLSSCKFFEETSLDQQQPVNQKFVLGTIPSVDVTRQNNGIIDTFDEEAWKCDTNKIFLADWMGQLRIRSDSAGPGREFIYKEFSPMSFENSRFLQLKAVVEKEKIPLLQAELVDRNGKSVAAIGKASAIDEGDPNQLVYRFEFPQSFFVGNKSKFEHTQVVEIRVYLHAAGDSYSGVIYLDELKAVRNP